MNGTTFQRNRRHHTVPNRTTPPHRGARVRLLIALATITTLVVGTAAPVAAAAPQAFDGFSSTKVDTSVMIYPNAYDPDGDALTIQITNGPANGSLDDCSDGLCTYTPNAGFTGTDTFNFTGVAGGETSNEATYTIEVVPNYPPVALDGNFRTKVGQPIFFYLSAYDSNGDPLTFLVMSGPGNGSLDDCEFGPCTYTPDAGFEGTDSLEFVASDGQAISNAATVTITVAPNRPPYADDQTVTTSINTPVSINLFAGDIDFDPITYLVTGGPSSGTLDDCTIGFCTYTPSTDFLGSDSFTFTVNDGEATSNEATVTVDVVPPCAPAVCIDNGTVLLAVNPEAHLNTPDATGSAAGPRDAGLHYLPTGNESTSPGCLCEGWGAADATTGVTGYANVSSDGGAVNLDLESFTSTASTAVSTVTIDDTLRVTHDFHPSPDTDDLYEVLVTIENTTGTTLDDVRYRRVMDWDIEPTPFSEYVTIDGGSSANLLYSSDQGFATGNPLGARGTILFEGEAVDSGPADHGALFDFGFGGLDAGESLQFRIFYGAAGTELGAISAIASVGAEVYSFGQPSTTDGPTLGTPNTFIFAFAGVGGDPVFAPLAGDDVIVTAQDTPGSVNVLTNDSDPNGDPITVTSWSAAANGSVTCQPTGLCTYTPNPGFVGSDSFTYTIEDGTGGSATATVRVTVTEGDPPDNEPPVVDAGSDASGTEGSPIGLAGSASDPDGDTLTTSWSYTAGPGTDPGATCNFSAPTSLTTNITCTDDGTYTATLTVNDGTNPAVTDTTTVTVANAAPTVTITAPTDGSTVNVGDTIGLTATITDPGTNDTHTCTIDWGDGTTTAGTITAGTCTASHTYTTIAVPTITVTATDDDGATGTDQIMLVVVDQSVKVTGGGWLRDSNGDRVSTGFVAGPGASGPAGQIQIRVHHGLRFHGYTVDSITASGSTATWSGSGRLGGADGYRFQITIVDNGNGKSKKKGGPDTVALTIFDAGGGVVYSVSGALQGGNVKVH